MRAIRKFAAAILAIVSLASRGHAFNATALRANCTNADFEMSISPAEYRASNAFEVSITTSSGERKDGLFPLLGTDPTDPLFVYPNNLSTSITITWKTPMQSGGDASWVFTLYNGSTPILYPGRTFIDTGTVRQYVDCTPPPNATTTTTAAAGSTSTTISSAGGIVPGSSTSAPVGADPTASTSSGNSKGSGDSSSSAGAIAGGVVGGVLGLALIAVLAAWLFRRKKAAHAYQNHPGATEAGAGTGGGTGGTFDQKHPQGAYGAPAGAIGAGPGGLAHQHLQSQHTPHASLGSDARPMSATPSAFYPSTMAGWTQQAPSQPFAHGGPSSHHTHTSLYGVPAGLAGGGLAAAGAAAATTTTTTGSAQDHNRRGSSTMTNSLPQGGGGVSTSALPPSTSTSSPHHSVLGSTNPLLASWGGGAPSAAPPGPGPGPGPGSDGLPAYDGTARPPVLRPEKAAHIREHVLHGAGSNQPAGPSLGGEQPAVGSTPGSVPAAGAGAVHNDAAGDSGD
ncbi:hypothetical protein OC844_002743 [Tilletia horrida]|nr:hypothetical protein OC844_002743 [Tilletia horrida]